MKEADEKAILDNLFDGTALPSHLSRSRAGMVLPRVRTARETAAEEARRFNQEITDNATAKMERAPLMAICYNHVCRCGNAWQAFGFYARRVTERVPGQAATTFTKRLTYDPGTERAETVTWQTREETVCIQCYNGPTVASALDVRGRIGAVTSLNELVKRSTVG